jgi:glycosyltransferase involved in cell wall biosynthesis
VSRSLNILLLSAYDAASHERWRRELEQQLPHHQWTQLSLPPRYFNWRIRGNSLTWAFTQKELLAQPYDLLIATSMVDLSALRGFIPALTRLPTLVYFHENQFVYPASDAQFSSVEPQMLTLYSALCADMLVFNSEFNRSTFLAGVENLLRRLPDGVPPGLPQRLNDMSQVLSVPLAAHCYQTATKSPQHFTVIWNHRWEYDKGPERLLAMLKIFFAEHCAAEKNSGLTLHVVGQQFRQQPPVFNEIKQLLEQHGALGQWGHVERAEDYRQLLGASHVVLSTALHDFQGLAVLEAVAAGCVPLVPNRQAYPEWFGSGFCYAGDVESPLNEANNMAHALHGRIEEYKQFRFPAAPDVSAFGWNYLKNDYDLLFHSAIARHQLKS